MSSTLNFRHFPYATSLDLDATHHTNSSVQQIGRYKMLVQDLYFYPRFTERVTEKAFAYLLFAFRH